MLALLLLLLLCVCVLWKGLQTVKQRMSQQGR
jgi:hypothetical protein